MIQFNKNINNQFFKYRRKSGILDVLNFSTSSVGSGFSEILRVLSEERRLNELGNSVKLLYERFRDYKVSFCEIFIQILPHLMKAEYCDLNLVFSML